MDTLIGIPWSSDGHDVSGCSCWGLVRLFYRTELGIELPDLAEGDKMQHAWRPVDTVTRGDVLLFRRGPYDRHVAVAMDNATMLHVDQDKCSCIENYRGPLWSHRLLKIYRHRQAG